MGEKLIFCALKKCGPDDDKTKIINALARGPDSGSCAWAVT